jgi:Trk K+ transport system NAD-binding subunit
MDRRRRRRAQWRETQLLFGEFGKPLLLFGGAILGCGILYAWLAGQFDEPVGSLPEALFLMLSLTFLQAFGEFPQHPLLQIFFFVMPLVGISLLAQGLTEFGIALFNRRSRSKEWEMAIASTFDSHIILVGLGHLGYRVVDHLTQMNQSVVVIEADPNADLLSAVQKMGVPVIQDDGSREAALEAAGVSRARTIVLCTQNDALNLKIAVKARSIKPDLKVVTRIFDDDFAQALTSQFGFAALSATGMSAPAFAAAAAGADITRPITIEGESFSLARLSVNPNSTLTRLTVADVERDYNVSIVLLNRVGVKDLHPPGETALKSGDALAVLGSPNQITLLMNDNR